MKKIPSRAPARQTRLKASGPKKTKPMKASSKSSQKPYRQTIVVMKRPIRPSKKTNGRKINGVNGHMNTVPAQTKAQMDLSKFPILIQTRSWNGLCAKRFEHAHNRLDECILVLYAGFFSDSTTMDSTAELLATEGYECHVLVPRYHGIEREADKLARHGLDDEIADLNGFIRSLGRKRIVLIGHSKGALVCNNVARDNPDIVKGFVSLMAPAKLRDILIPLINWRLFKNMPPLLGWRCVLLLPFYIGKIALKKPFRPSFANACSVLFNRLTPEKAKEAWQKLGFGSGRAANQILSGRYGLEPLPGCKKLVIAGKYDRFTPHQWINEKRLGRKYILETVQTSHAYMYDTNGAEEVARIIHAKLEWWFSATWSYRNEQNKSWYYQI